MGADDNVHGTVGQTAYDPGLSVTRAKARELLDPYRPVSEPVAERLVMLLREQGGGYEHGYLLAGLYCDEGGAHRHLGLAEADVAAYQAVHRCLPPHVGDDLSESRSV